MIQAIGGDYGSVVRQAETALVLVDVIHDFRYPGGEELLRHARPMAERVASLKTRLARMGVPAIYVNEETDRWKPSFSRQIDRCLAADAPGRPVVELLRPARHDFFVLKAVHSPCFLSSLEGLFTSLGANTLILTGLAANICLLLAADDMFMSGLRFIVPCDCVASKTAAQTASALSQMQQLFSAATVPSTDLFFSP